MAQEHNWCLGFVCITIVGWVAAPAAVGEEESEDMSLIRSRDPLTAAQAAVVAAELAAEVSMLRAEIGGDDDDDDDAGNINASGAVPPHAAAPTVRDDGDGDGDGDGSAAGAEAQGLFFRDLI